MRHVICLLSIAFLVCSCNHADNNDGLSIPEGQYAQGFILTEHENYTEVTILDPWEQGKVMQRYLLTKDSTFSNLPKIQNAIAIRVPLGKVAATSCTHVGFLAELDELQSLYGICAPKLIYTPLPNEQITDLGDAMQVNPERVLLLHPDAVIISTYAKTDGVRQYLEKSNIPIIYNNEWTEQSPLARAEWIRLLGAFYNKQQQADSIFQSIKSAYNSLQANVANLITTKRSIMAGCNFRGTWYMPSGKVYTGWLYKDAGASYLYENNQSDGSLPLSFETVLRNFRNADVWVNCTAHSMKQLQEMDDKHTWFKSYQTGQVYNFMKRTTSTGADDFWESGVVHPERLLADMVWILYPHLMKDYEPYYAQHLE